MLISVVFVVIIPRQRFDTSVALWTSRQQIERSDSVTGTYGYNGHDNPNRGSITGGGGNCKPE